MLPNNFVISSHISYQQDLLKSVLELSHHYQMHAHIWCSMAYDSVPICGNVPFYSLPPDVHTITHNNHCCYHLSDKFKMQCTCLNSMVPVITVS